MTRSQTDANPQHRHHCPHRRRQDHRHRADAVLHRPATRWATSIRAPRSPTSIPRSSSAASRSTRPASRFPWKDCRRQPHRHARPRRFHGRSGAEPARARWRRGGVQRPRRGRGPERNGLAAGRQIRRAPDRVHQQDGPRRGRFLRHARRNPQAAGLQSGARFRLPVGVGPPHVGQSVPRHRSTWSTMQMSDLSRPKARGRRSIVADIPPEMHDEAELWREQMLDQLFDIHNELAEMVLEEAAGAGGADPSRAARSDAAPHDRAGALRLGAGPHRRSAAAGRRGGLSAQPGRHAAGRRHRSARSRERQAHAQAERRRAVLRPGVQDSLPTSTAICTTSASIPAG